MLTLTAMMNRSVRLFGDRTAIMDPQGRLTWHEFSGRVGRAAAVLQSLGVTTGQRFGILCRNGFRNAELMQAGYWLGAVPVPINYRLAPPEIAYILNDAECRLVAVEDFFLELMQVAELQAWSDRLLFVAPTQTDRPIPQYEPLLASVQAAPGFEAGEDDDAIVVYTGGTTGRPKGVRLSHRNIVMNALQVGLETHPRADDIFLHVAPMFHSAEFISNPFFLSGAAHVYLPKFSGSAVLEAIDRFKVTCTLLTPTMIINVLQAENFHGFDISSLRQIFYGSAPMATEWIRKSMERLRGVEFIQGYGLTETAPILTILGMREHELGSSSPGNPLLGSAGRQLAGVELQIVNQEGVEVPTGDGGEVAVRGPNVAKGYLNRPEATDEAFRGGWFLTGDIGRLDEDGYLYLLDRKKDMIITGSELVFSLEVEAVLHQHPKVHECAVVGVPDEAYGEALLAAIVPRGGATLTGEELIEFCRGKIGGFKIPRRYIFLAELPRSAMNKVLKGELRRQYGRSRQ